MPELVLQKQLFWRLIQIFGHKTHKNMQTLDILITACKKNKSFPSCIDWRQREVEAIHSYHCSAVFCSLRNCASDMSQENYKKNYKRNSDQQVCIFQWTRTEQLEEVLCHAETKMCTCLIIHDKWHWSNTISHILANKWLFGTLSTYFGWWRCDLTRFYGCSCILFSAVNNWHNCHKSTLITSSVLH